MSQGNLIKAGSVVSCSTRSGATCKSTLFGFHDRGRLEPESEGPHTMSVPKAIVTPALCERARASLIFTPSRGRVPAARLAKSRTCVSFFGPDRFAADDLGWILFKVFERDITLFVGARGKGVRNGLLHQTSIQNRREDYRLVYRQQQPVVD